MIKPTHSESFSEADLNLIRISPRLYDTLLTVNGRLEELLSSQDIQVPSDVGNELSDIQNVILDVLNDDGQLNGTAEWENSKETPPEETPPKEKKKYLCCLCGHEEFLGDKTGDGGLCPKCGGDNWLEQDDLDNPGMASVVDLVCLNLSITKEELRKKF